MKLKTPEIVWHDRQPVLSADFHRNGADWRLATAGTDNDVKMWKLVAAEDGQITVEFMSNLSRHSRGVNVVRFSPSGEFLASGSDDNVVCLWRRSEGANDGGNLTGDDSVTNKETWTIVKMLRGHIEDIYDLCWSPDSNFIITGSVDNTAIIWDVAKGQQLNILSESKQYVQGVAWDPLGQYVATLSCDRSMRVYSTDQKFKCLHTVSKLTTTDQQSEASKQFRMWIDEGLSSFFRRLTFTPDGLLLIVPAGRFEVGEKSKNCTYIFARHNLTKPVMQLPGPEKPTVAVRCCPVLFELLPGDDRHPPSCSVFSLPYRVVYAVASLDSLLLYDTQHSAPFAYVSNIHYAGITDLTWSSNAQFLVVTSSDGYCSILSFEPGELGVPLSSEKLPALLASTNEKSKSEVTVSSENSPTPPPQSAAGPQKETSEQSVRLIKPRRIRPTTVASFCSPDKQKVEVVGADNKDNEESRSSVLSSPLLPNSVDVLPPSLPSQSTTNSEPDPISATLAPSKDGAKMKQNSTGCESHNNQNPSSSSGAPRRVNFVTLSSVPSTLTTPKPLPPLSEVSSNSLQPQSLQMSPKTGQTYPSHGREEEEGKKGSKTEEPMEVPTIE